MNSMLVSPPVQERQLRTLNLSGDLVVVGGGLAGLCCAIAAARSGTKVVLIQDRPVLGGNASSEVRLWVLGATSHMGNNNRWAREGGVVDEILVENLFRNPEGNPIIFDTILIEKVIAETNITLLLNTCVFEAIKNDEATIGAVRAFCSQNSTMYEISAPLFCDASGDGILGFLAGAAFRMGAEARDEFGEMLAPEKSSRELLGHTIYFYSRDTGRPVRFVAPSYALQQISQIPRWRQFKPSDSGCQLWWIEYGGMLDTVHDTEQIKWELWRIVYGVWNHIKNSGQFPEAEHLTLEWVGTVPGKRESRRFEGDYILTQQDIIEQHLHADAVSFGGWAIDLHPADGVFSAKPGCTQWHSKGVYQVPYRCMYSRNINNLFLAGRIISTSHIAFGSTRVMATCAHNAQAVGIAATLCRRHAALPRDISQGDLLKELQRELLKIGQHIPQIEVEDPRDLARIATISASSSLRLSHLPPDGSWIPLDRARAMLLPLPAGPVPRMTLFARALERTELTVQLRGCSRRSSFTPDQILESMNITVDPGDSQPMPIQFRSILEKSRYMMLCILPNPLVSMALSARRVTGVLSLSHSVNHKVSKSAVQEPPDGTGIDRFEFWLPQRRPGGSNLAIEIAPPLPRMTPQNLALGPERPTDTPNAWVAEFADPNPSVEFDWPEPVRLGRVTVCLDSDFDHPMESVLMGHPEREIPFCVKTLRFLDDRGRVLAEVNENHQTRSAVNLNGAMTTKLRIEFRPREGAAAAAFRVRIEQEPVKESV